MERSSTHKTATKTQLATINKALYFKSFHFFVSNCLGLSVAPFHKEIIQNLTNKKLVVVAPRGHGKSEMIAVSYALWTAFKSEEAKCILIVSATEKQATHILERIKNYIEDIPLLNSLLKPEAIHTTKWAGTEIKCKNGCKIMVYPLASSVRGEHVDLCICDDILKDEVGTHEKSKQFFTEIIRPTVNTKKGQLVVVGTPQSYVDLLADLSDPELAPDWKALRYKAVIVDAKGEWDKALWAERFSLDELRAIKAGMGSAAWSKEYMCEPISSGTALYPWELVSSCINKKIEQLSEGKKNKNYYLGVDVALSEKASADYTVMIVGEQSAENQPLRVVRVERMKGWGSDRLMAKLIDLHGTFQFKKAILEQMGVSYDLATQLTQHPLCRSSFEGFTTTRNNKEKILSGLEIIMRNKQLEFPKNDTLIEEMLSFGIKDHASGKQTYEALGKHDDTVIALALMVEASKGNSGKLSVSFI